MQQLNPQQIEAIESVNGPILVLAGAGSGKTKVVTQRIVRLIEKGVPASKILAVTFTNKAAGEMKERVMKLTHAHVLISTFHSLGARILRESIQELGYTRDFTIYDEDDAEKLLKACLQEAGIHDKKAPKLYRNFISTVKNEMKDAYDEELDHSREVYNLYQSKLKECNAVDFDDLLFLTVKLLSEYPHILSKYQHRWEYLMIDEYQDTNSSQYTLMRLLVEKSQNLFVVGDPDQSIYSWRGANIQNILNFEKDFSGAKVIRLELNYRSRTNILEAANELISHNENRYKKNLWSELGEGAKIRRFTGYDERDEARFVAKEIQHHKRNGIPLKNVVVFYRTNAQSRPFEDQFLMNHIPYTIVGGISFYQRREIKDILAFIRVAVSGADFVSFARTINIPKRGIGDTTLDKLREAAGESGMKIFDFCESFVNGQVSLKLSAKVKEGLKQYVEIIQHLRSFAQTNSVVDAVKAAVEQTSYLQYLAEDKETFLERKDNVGELITKAVEWELATEEPSISAFLEELSLKSNLDEADDSTDRVSLMTIHNGKGLEFVVTFLVGMEEDLFPHINSRDSLSGLEEERRLCYVGMTRAKEYLYLTDSQIRYLWGAQKMQRPSRFIKEISPEYLERVKVSSLFFN